MVISRMRLGKEEGAGVSLFLFFVLFIYFFFLGGGGGGGLRDYFSPEQVY